jgi:hypothetical protein
VSYSVLLWLSPSFTFAADWAIPITGNSHVLEFPGPQIHFEQSTRFCFSAEEQLEGLCHLYGANERWDCVHDTHDISALSYVGILNHWE